MTKVQNPSCSECGQTHCYRQDKKFPTFCLTQSTDDQVVERTLDTYRGDTADAAMARAAAEVEGLHYGKIGRVEEIVAFARRIGAQRIGIATCLGLIEESKVFVKVLRAAKLEPLTVLCKVGSVDKTDIGLAASLKIKCNSFEALCNPILQAQLLNEEKTQLNVIMGLCVGHDCLFIKHSDAPVTTLVTKDRVTGHNPVATLHTAHSYSSRILDSKHLLSL